MNSDLHPLQKLADASYTKKQIVRMLERKADLLAEDLASKNLVPHQALSSRIRRSLEDFLLTRAFAGFSRKRTLDLAVAKAIRRERNRYWRNWDGDLSALPQA